VTDAAERLAVERFRVEQWLRREQQVEITDGWARYVLVRLPDEIFARFDVKP
jgi:hypothetical protein